MNKLIVGATRQMYNIIPIVLAPLIVRDLPSLYPLTGIPPSHLESFSHLAPHCRLPLGICYNTLHLCWLEFCTPMCLFIPPISVFTRRISSINKATASDQHIALALALHHSMRSAIKKVSEQQSD